MKRHVNIPAHWIEISLADASLTQLAMPWQEINTFNSGTWEVSSENMLILSWEAQRPSVGTLAADPEEWWNTVIVLHFYLEIVKDLQEGPAQPWPSFLWWSHLHNHRGCTNASTYLLWTVYDWTIFTMLTETNPEPSPPEPWNDFHHNLIAVISLLLPVVTYLCFPTSLGDLCKRVI